MLSSIRSAVANMSGYLSGLSSPSVTESTTTLSRLAEVEGGRADEVADVLDEQHAARRGRQRLERVADHVRVEMAALAGVDLDRRRAGGADPLRIVRGLLIALDDGDRHRDP